MNRSGRKRRSSCVDGEVCANTVISKRKKLKKTLDTAGVVRDALLILARHSLKAELQEFLESTGRRCAAVM